jgi:hypothetical protein
VRPEPDEIEDFSSSGAESDTTSETFPPSEKSQKTKRLKKQETALSSIIDEIKGAVPTMRATKKNWAQTPRVLDMLAALEAVLHGSLSYARCASGVFSHMHDIRMHS